MISGFITNPDWSATELSALYAFYPNNPRKDVRAAIPNRSWHAINQRASLLGIVRRYRKKNAVSRAKPKRAFIADLIKSRTDAKLTQDDLARVIGVAGQCKMSGMESERVGVSLAMLEAWCGALGMELRAVQVREPRQIRAINKPESIGQRLRSSASRDMAARLRRVA